MPPLSPDLINREEALGGLTARRARTLLFLIESRSARLTARDQQAIATYQTERAAEEDELAFFAAFTEGRDPPLKPTIQDIERFASAWAPLVPGDPRIRAAVAHALAAKYRFTEKDIPGIRTALCLDDPRVQQSYLNQFRAPITGIYQVSSDKSEYLRWRWARLAGQIDSLPPFWTSFALTFTETVGSGILALPIALAGIGPLPGILLLIVLGLVNLLTVVCAAEAAARSGSVRYGSGFIGRMVTDYLGSLGGSVLTTGVAIFSAIQLFAMFIGFGAIMASFIGLPQPAWVVGLFFVSLYFLRRESLNATIVSALLVGAISIAILFLLLLLALSRLDPANLLYFHVPFINGEPFKPALLELIFGVILAAFFGHLSVNNCAKVVLRRDASARSLIGGAAAAQIVSIVIYSIWTLAIAGAVPPTVLASETGTALEPLADRIGPIALVVSTVYAVLTLAMGSIYNSLSLFNLVAERLPGRTQHTIRLSRRSGHLVFTSRESIRGLFRRPQEVRCILSYLGLDGASQAETCPRLRLDLNLNGEIHSLDISPSYTGAGLRTGGGKEDRGNGHWSESELAGLVPDLHKRGVKLDLDVIEATPDYIRLTMHSSMAVRYEGRWESAGPDLDALLAWSEVERRVWKWLSRQMESRTVSEIAAGAGADESSTREALKVLIKESLAGENPVDGAIRYQARFAMRRGHTLPEALDSLAGLAPGDKPIESENKTIDRKPALLANLNRRSRYWICSLPIIAVFILSEWLLVNGQASFSAAYSLSGVLLGSLLAGFFPTLLMAASRRKGDVVPGFSPRLVGHPLVLTTVYLVFLSGVLVYGLIIWQGIFERAAAIGVSLLAIVLPFVLLSRGAFKHRFTVEIRGNAEGTQPAVFAVSAAGHAQPSEVQLHYARDNQCSMASSGEIPDFSTLRGASFRPLTDLSKTRANLPRGKWDVKVWAHQVMGAIEDQPLPVTVAIHNGDRLSTFELDALGGQVVVPLAGSEFELQCDFHRPT